MQQTILSLGWLIDTRFIVEIRAILGSIYIRREGERVEEIVN